MLDFPASPVNGQQYSAPNGVVYMWQSPPGMWIAAAVATGTFLPLTGGTVTGETTIARNYTVSDPAPDYALYVTGTIDGATSDFNWGGSVINIAESIDHSSATLGGTVSGLVVSHAGYTGYAARNGILGVYAHMSPTSTPPSKAFYTGIFAVTPINSGDGGGPGTPKGNFYGFGGVVSAYAAATHLQGVIGAEFDVALVTGASTSEKIILQLANVNSDAVKGSTVDAALLIAGDTSITAQFDYGIVFGKPGNHWNVSGTLVGTYTTTNAMAAVNGVDFSAVTFSGSAFKSTNFAVSGTGALTGTSAAFSGAISSASGIQVTHPYANIGMAEGGGAAVFRWSLNNNGTLSLQSGPSGTFTSNTIVVSTSNDVTLVGALTGTSATFSSTMVVGNTILTGGSITSNTGLQVTNAFGTVVLSQGASAAAFRWALANNGTLSLQNSPDSTFGGGTTNALVVGATNGLSLTNFPTSLYANAIAAGANTQAFIKASSTANFGLYYGSGAPGFTAAANSLYLRTDGSTTTTRMYVNTTGSTTWATVTTSA